MRTVNLLDRYVNLTRSTDDKVFVEESAQLIIKDLMGTNGVLHIIDKVIIPDACKSNGVFTLVETETGTGTRSKWVV